MFRCQARTLSLLQERKCSFLAVMQYINQNCGKMQVVTTLCQLQCGMAQVCTVPRAVAVQVLWLVSSLLPICLFAFIALTVFGVTTRLENLETSELQSVQGKVWKP